MTWFLYAAVLAVGFALGRARLGTRLVDWAEDAATLSLRSWKFWLAAPVVLAAIVCVWIVHPRRSLANVRSWRAGERLHPAPVFDPDWAAKRHATTEAPQ